MWTSPRSGRALRAAARGAVLAGLTALFFGPAAAQVAPAGAAPDPALTAALAQLRAAAPKARIGAGLATGLQLALPGDTPAARAEAFLTAYKGLFPLGPGGSLKAEPAQGRSVRLAQYAGDLPVRHAGVTLAFDADGRLKGYTDETKVVTSVAAATLDADGAARLARAALGLSEVGNAPVIRRTVSVGVGPARIVYEVDLLAGAPLDVRRVLVDAVDAKVIGQESLVRP